MRKIRMGRLAATATVLWLLSSFALWAQSDREFHWSGKLAPDQVVEIKGVNGEIEAEAASGDTVEVTAEKSGPDSQDVRIVAVPSPEGVTICALYAGSGSECKPGKSWHVENVHGDRTRVHFLVRVPPSVRFSGNNINGDVNAENMGQVVHASTVNGAVRISTKAWAEASSVNGSIDASMGTADWNGKLRIHSVNGSIRLTLPDTVNSDVKFSSVNGRLSTDFPLTVDGSLNGRHVEGRIGSGGRELELETVNGNVDLRKGTL